MTPRPRHPRPGQTSLDDLLRAHPDALRVERMRTGWPVAVLAGGMAAPDLAPIVARKAA